MCINFRSPTAADIESLRERSCARKRRHRTKRKAILFYNQSRHYTGPLDVYGCAFCDGWHHGHPPRNPAVTRLHARLPEILAAAGAVARAPQITCQPAN